MSSDYRKILFVLLLFVVGLSIFFLNLNRQRKEIVVNTNNEPAKEVLKCDYYQKDGIEIDCGLYDEYTGVYEVVGVIDNLYLKGTDAFLGLKIKNKLGEEKTVDMQISGYMGRIGTTNYVSRDFKKKDYDNAKFLTVATDDFETVKATLPIGKQVVALMMTSGDRGYCSAGNIQLLSWLKGESFELNVDETCPCRANQLDFSW